ncbi:hypothetical protein ACWGLF_38030 [Streptomyces puniciscabiei]
MELDARTRALAAEAAKAVGLHGIEAIAAHAALPGHSDGIVTSKPRPPGRACGAGAARGPLAGCWSTVLLQPRAR